jgi:hypothetical protein
MIYKSSRIRIADEGAIQGYVRAVDFVGAGVTASIAAGIATITISGGGAGAPTDAEYLVATANAGLSAERVATGTATISWDFSVGGQAQANVNNDSITYAKIQNVSATDRLLGRVSAGSGDVEEIVFTDTAQTLLDDTSAAAMRTTLGVAAAPSWYGNIYASMGNCDPQKGLEGAIWTGSNAVTPTQLTTTVARISYFVPPADIVVNKIRFYGAGTVASVYTCAIYNGDTLARLTTSLTLSTTSGAWGSVGSALNLTLTAGQLYFMAVSVNTTGTTAGLMCLGTSMAAPAQAQITVLPKSWPGNLDIDSKYICGAYAQFAVTAGAMPDPAATIATQGAWTGGMPLFFLDNNNA